MNQCCNLARQAIRCYLENGTVLKPPEDLPEEFFNRQCGVFVTIKNGNHLRGCIGTYLPTKENVAQEIIENAIAVATRDGRFQPVSRDEIDGLTFEVSLLQEPKQILDLSNHDPKIYGLIVKSVDFPYKTGILLPALEKVDAPEKQFMIACQKAGINHSKENIEIYRFTVEKYQN